MSTSTDFADAPVSISSWLRGLCYRPLVWLTPACALGGGAGLMLGVYLHGAGVTRGALVCYWPLLPLFSFLLLALRLKNQAFSVRLALFFAFACLCAVAGALRALPPPGDISLQQASSIAAPLSPTTLTLRGWVADFPSRGMFSQEFPFECAQAGSKKIRGYLWIKAPLKLTLQPGDEIELREAPIEAIAHASNPGQRDIAWRFINAGCWGRARLKLDQIRVLRRGAKYPMARFIAKLREHIATHYEAAFAGNLHSRPYPQARAQLLTAMVFGRGGLEEALPRRTQDNFRASGLMHLLVASGQQVTLLAAILLGAAHLLGVRRWWLLLFVLPTIVLYALVAGGAASIWRAAIGGVCLALAILQGRDVDGLSLWSLAFMALFFIDPACLMDLSFQLTFAATWGLIALAPPLRRFLGRTFGESSLIDVAALTLAAQGAVFPLMLFQFGNASWAGMGCNLFAVPLCGILVLTGVAGLFLPLATFVNYPLTSAIDGLAAFAAQLPGASVETAPLKFSTALLSWLMLLGAAALPVVQAPNGIKNRVQEITQELLNYLTQRNYAIRWQRVLAALLLVTALWAAQREWKLQHAPLRVTLLDVGQGEAIVIQSPSGRTVLIDGGSLDVPEIGRSVIVPYLQFIGAQQLDAVVITHSDADHCNGIAQVAHEMPIKMLLDGAWQPDDMLAVDYQGAKLALRRQGTGIVKARAGQRLDLGDGAVLTVLAPLEPPLSEAADNNNAAVLRLDYGSTNFLLTADIQKEAEERLVQRGVLNECTILKVAHHGSNTSTTAAFLRRVAPRAAIISCGRYNRFRHPAPQILKSLAARNVPVFRTDLNGAIEITSDGSACVVQTYR